MGVKTTKKKLVRVDFDEANVLFESIGEITELKNCGDAIYKRVDDARTVASYDNPAVIGGVSKIFIVEVTTTILYRDF